MIHSRPGDDDGLGTFTPTPRAGEPSACAPSAQDADCATCPLATECAGAAKA